MTTGVTVWFTGLSGSGKSTLSAAVQQILLSKGKRVELLDGDEIRKNICKGLGFSKEDRDTNVLRVGYVCSLLTRNGVIVLAAAISPYSSAREKNRDLIGNYVEVFVDCPLEVLKSRDTKGLYRKALNAEIPNFTGISDPYEPPEHPDVYANTHEETVEESRDKVIRVLSTLGHI